MKKLILLVICVSLGLSAYCADEVEKISLQPPKDLVRADLYVWKKIRQPKAVLVLCPGKNGSAEELIKQEAWQKFAKQQQLGLAGLSFASDADLLNRDSHRGYYYAEEGSGQALLNCIKKAYGKDLPIIPYGFSGGAYFTGHLVEWRPERILTWCAYSASWWNIPQPSKDMPPGIVACGDEDPALGASLIFFKQGRALGKPWLWIDVAKTGHATNSKLDAFVRNYIAAVLKLGDEIDPAKEGIWIDVDRLIAINPAIENPVLTGWLPQADLLEDWKGVNRQ
ncbi:MAG: hypothetical protein LBH01_06465 [Verrucomicrobiales bacterium]|nr:hypothetical protein [Verrucomicrobiales bacterium]